MGFLRRETEDVPPLQDRALALSRWREKAVIVRRRYADYLRAPLGSFKRGECFVDYTEALDAEERAAIDLEYSSW